MRARRTACDEQRMDLAGHGLALDPRQIDVVDRDLHSPEPLGGGAGQGGLAGALRPDDGDQRAILWTVGDQPADQIDELRICAAHGRRSVLVFGQADDQAVEIVRDPDRHIQAAVRWTFSAKSSIDSSMAEARPVSVVKASST